MAYRLPPLNSLRLFEAAGRRLSFKLAAEELNLTPSAISHGIQSLEEWLGVELFLRGNRNLTLTGAGAVYLPQVRAALEMIVKASDGVPGRRSSGKLAVSVSPTFAMRWLLPRLQRFGHKHPDIEVSVDTTQRQVEFPRDGVDLAIRMGNGNWPELYATCLIREKLVPVCAPKIARSIRSAADLNQSTLLHVISASEDWATWCHLAEVQLGEQSRGLRFDSIHMAMDAAARGMGIAVGRLPLVEADIAAGRLTAVLGPPRLCNTGYWLVAGQDSVRRPEVSAFRDWIRTELGETSQVSESPSLDTKVISFERTRLNAHG